MLSYTIIESTPSFVYGRFDLADTSSLSESIEEAIDEDGYHQGEVGSDCEDSDEPDIELETRQATINWLQGDFDFKDEITDLVREINDLCLDVHFDYAPDWQYTVYIDPNDHYDWHQDFYEEDEKDEDFKRTLSASFCLSSDDCYEGAEFFIKDQSETNVRVFKMRYGDFILFPSDVEHRVNALRSGERISLVVWFGVDLDDNN